MADEDSNQPFSDNVVVLLMAMGAAAFVVSMYHVVTICFCNQQQRNTNQNPPQQQHQPPHHVAVASPSLDQSISSSVAHLIPTHKYHKKSTNKDSNVGDDQGGGTCAVCLGDFEEGEELRSLPECLHSFHVQCIDMWLHSNLSCPICRASAAPSPAVNEHHSIDISMTPVAFLQSGLVRW